MVQGFHHAGVAVADVPRAVEFYEAVLEFEPIGPDDPSKTAESADYFWLAIDEDQWLNLAHRPDATPDGPGRRDDPHLAFAAAPSEVDAIGRRLERRGVESHATETSRYFRDPDDNLVEVTHWDGPGDR